MEWEVELIEWIQKTLGSLNSTVGTVMSFVGGEIGQILVSLVVLFCWKRKAESAWLSSSRRSIPGCR